MSEFVSKNRGSKGVTTIKFKEKAGGGVAKGEAPIRGKHDALSCMRIVREGDEVRKINVVKQKRRRL
jgi:hypothetical protein